MTTHLDPFPASLAIRGASAEAIRAHYDVSNEFYALWLDPSRTYSCAFWESGHETLAEAQSRKLDWYAEQVHASGAARVLEIGCGWGGLMERLVTRYGVGEVVGLTLSEAQASFVRAHRPRNCVARVESWVDYSSAEPFDAIVSLGAIEHFVRPEHSDAERVAIYRQFFEKCRSLLRPGAWLGLQSICYGRGAYFPNSPISAIFPESDMPRMSQLLRAADGVFEPKLIRQDGQDYARTCSVWLGNLMTHRAEAVALVGEATTECYRRFLVATEQAFRQGIFQLCRLILSSYP